MPRNLLGVALADRAGAFDLELVEGCVSGIRPAQGAAPARWLAMPSLVNSHAHANRAFAAPLLRPSSLGDAVTSARKERLVASAQDIHARALKFFQRSMRHGVSAVRTHTDIDGVTGMRAIDGVRAAAGEVAAALDVEIVAFASAAADPADPGTQALFAAAVARGASLIGAVPALCARPAQSLDALLDAALALEVAVDLQARGSDSPRVRDLAPVAEALRAGVAVRFGTDNVRDWFFPFGDADMLETGLVGAMATHVDDAQALSGLICGGRRGIETGDAADLLLVPAASFDDALARRPAGRILLRHGQAVDTAAASGESPFVDTPD